MTYTYYALEVALLFEVAYIIISPAEQTIPA